MKLFPKVFLAVILILCCSLSLSGYLLISISYRQAVDKEIGKALDQYQMVRFILESKPVGENTVISTDRDFFTDLIPESYDQNAEPRLLAVFSEDMQVLYSDYPSNHDFSLLKQVNEEKLYYKIQQAGDSYILTVMGRFKLDKTPIYLAVGTNINSVIEQRNQMEHGYTLVYSIVCTLGTIATLIFSILLVRPIQKITRSTARIAAGDYSVRVSVRTHDELGELENSFNIMADAVEDGIRQLTENAEQKEEFISNFAHELKTPLTSVIGYADMICQKSMTTEQIKHAAQYILDEGLRLEELFIKLMDLIVLGKQDFVLEELPARDLLLNIAETLTPVLAAQKIELTLLAQDAYVRVEFDLFKTLLLNLLDNAIKADSTSISLKGEVSGDRYRITVSDNGRGIPQANLHRITEAFYMVDKSRSRKQHGAGLGLALVAKIAKLHGASLKFKSKENVGTVVTVTLPTKGYEETCENI